MHIEYPAYILENRQFLQQIANTKSEKTIAKLLKTANTEQILAIAEIIHNILQSNILLQERQRRKLAKNADYYRHLNRSRSETSFRKKLQKGGQIGAIAAIIAPVLSAIAQQILDRTLSKI